MDSISLPELQVKIERLAQLDEECYDTMRHSYRPSTLKNLKSQALIYRRFCDFYGLQMFPAGAWQLVRYARYIANTVTSVETVGNYVSGVRRLHQLGGFPVPSAQEPNFQQLMRGLKFELAHPIKQAAPMTPDLLRRIYHMVDFSRAEELVSYTAILIGFYMFLRRSNLAPETQEGFQEGRHLTRGDVRLGQALVVVEVRWSKTLQYKQKTLLLPLIPAKFVEICPIYWLRVMTNRIHARPNDPLFSIPVGEGKVQPLVCGALQERLRKWVEQVGVNPSPFSLHCLRRGGATWAIEAGLVSSDLKVMGDWASDSFMRYIDSTLQRRVDGMVQFMEHM